MGKDPDREELRYVPPNDSQEEIHPDVAQDPDEIALKSLSQAPNGQEIEPSKGVIEHAVGKPRRKTVGIIDQGDQNLKAQDPFRVDVTVYENEGTGQKEFERTSDVLSDFQQTGVLATDFPERPISDAEAIDLTDVSGPLFSTVRKQEGGASRKYTPVGNPGSRLVVSQN